MADNLKNFLHSGKLNGPFLDVKVVKKLSSNLHIIADSSAVAVLDTSEAPAHGKALNIDGWFKLIKCQRMNKEKVCTNKKFKPVKSFSKQEIKNIDPQIEMLEKSLETSSAS